MAEASLYRLLCSPVFYWVLNPSLECLASAAGSRPHFPPSLICCPTRNYVPAGCSPLSKYSASSSVSTSSPPMNSMLPSAFFFTFDHPLLPVVGAPPESPPLLSPLLSGADGDELLSSSDHPKSELKPTATLPHSPHRPHWIPPLSSMPSSLPQSTDATKAVFSHTGISEPRSSKLFCNAAARCSAASGGATTKAAAAAATERSCETSCRIKEATRSTRSSLLTASVPLSTGTPTVATYSHSSRELSASSCPREAAVRTTRRADRASRSSASLCRHDHTTESVVEGKPSGVYELEPPKTSSSGTAPVSASSSAPAPASPPSPTSTSLASAPLPSGGWR
mmetsp:Transcript_12762/g.39699  ORF Transcript_12762/g.39699 Transcript_12762/m.39699 type:complete len:338 (+) Transcript_12762:1489-2502(+)